jgi:tetratricopeptide (TPR) repeat protein
MSEDMNIEHLLDTFTSIDVNSDEVWDACYHFMEHLAWHKPRLVVLGLKIKGLPDDHPSKAKCMSRLAWLFHLVGNYMESRQLLIHTLKLWREQGNDPRVAEALWSISTTNRMLHLYGEGMQQTKEAYEIYERLDNLSGQARSLAGLAYLLHDEGQLNAAEETASQVIDRFQGKGERWEVCGCYRLLGRICREKGETENAINHLKTALEIATPFNWPIFFFLDSSFPRKPVFRQIHV